MGISILAVSLPEELLKDAVWHLQQARTFEGDQANCFLLWREVRSAIMFAVTAVEALFNMAATEHVARHPDLPSPIRDHLLEQESRVNREGAVEQRFRLVPLEDKISVWTRIITGKSSTSPMKYGGASSRRRISATP